MSFLLNDKRILLGISGGIAAYKAADWVRQLRREGAEVTVMMTDAAQSFVTPLTFAALSGKRVHTTMLAAEDGEYLPHINLGRDHDLVLLAPATANTIARLARGQADELVSTVVLAARAKILLCPAMNSEMYRHPATQYNLGRLKEYGYTIIEPDCGELACGDQGPGRLAEWETVRQAVIAALTPQDLLGRNILVTAGPTWEPLDPVRLLTNRSSGKMGYALAAAARRRGASVTLVSGPGSITPPAGVELIPVVTATEMHQAVCQRVDNTDIMIMAAAVSDYRPAHYEPHKIKKGATDAALPLVSNPDILRELGERKKSAACFPLLVGFAAESENHRDEGQRKLTSKNLDLIAINDISAEDAGFAVDNNRVTLLDRNGAVEELPLLSKEEVAHRILNTILRLI
ncbi:bifunctional phosphopantothenoylcysteine decarboxylase/phosphopantothenate--cysteine ligase CoaBC [Desulfurivibrio dismutans]|uniref:bifunctional phosphopantothenoylcysteine decarboxylase/phosphopantothenate--cysteine ligase CoaBC n=1 Tax=Desulfurivibrio dismutans TaxID=1398908 RepID=UPI0023DCC348|nr:bifunctional phosphopantothenoylcysteine decarboxylase/phosphopantothenate--cysteine ligase CoaBC [Desulfurivibrio alkaliphilus]